MAQRSCSLCDQEFPEEELRDVTFFGRTFWFCPDDFSLVWQGVSGVAAVCEQLKAASTAGTKLR